jgi:sulfotransferase
MTAMRYICAMSTIPRTIHFISGMPRSGSTILGNILAQNPRFYVTPTSGLVDLLAGMRTGYDKIGDFRAAPNEGAKMGAIRGALFGHFEPVSQPVVFDRNRGWVFELEMLEVLLRRKARVIVCVRDIAEILCSLEKLWRENKAFRTVIQQEGKPVDFQSLEGRCKTWLDPAQPVGRAYIGIQDALTRGFRDRMHFVHFDYLTRNPTGALQDIYRFLEEPAYAHDFEHVEQVTREDDVVHGIKGLHDIRPAVRPVPRRAKEVLGALADTFKGPFIWDEHIAKEKR